MACMVMFLVFYSHHNLKTVWLMEQEGEWACAGCVASLYAVVTSVGVVTAVVEAIKRVVSYL